MKVKFTAKELRSLSLKLKSLDIRSPDTISYSMRIPLRFKLEDIGFYRDLGLIKVTDRQRDPLDEMLSLDIIPLKTATPTNREREEGG
jgi:hypothetical protein